MALSLKDVIFTNMSLRDISMKVLDILLSSHIAVLMQVWLDRSLVGHIRGALAGLGHVVAFCWVSPGFSSLRQKRTSLS